MVFTHGVKVQMVRPYFQDLRAPFTFSQLQWLSGQHIPLSNYFSKSLSLFFLQRIVCLHFFFSLSVYCLFQQGNGKKDSRAQIWWAASTTWSSTDYI